MDLNLWFNPSLLEKTRQKAAEARSADRPFVPKTIASSTVNPYNPYQNPTSPFSTSSYTSTSSLSNPPLLVPGAGGAFSRTNYSTIENQVQQAAATGSFSTTTTTTTTGGGYSSPLPGLSPEQPNRLVTPSGIDIAVICFCVIDENSAQQLNDKPSVFYGVMEERFPDFGDEIKHITFNFLENSGDLVILEPVDNERSFLVVQPRVDGYDWLSRIEELVGELDPDRTLILYCIDDSGSMTKNDVAESLAIFAARTADYAEPPIDVLMFPSENMFLPFIRDDVLVTIEEVYDRFE